MIVEYIRYQMTANSAQDLIGAYAEAGKYLQAAPECLGYELTQCSDDPSSLILRIEWTSAESHTTGFRKSAHFAPFLRLIRPYFKEIAEMRHYDPVQIVWRRA